MVITNLSYFALLNQPFIIVPSPHFFYQKMSSCSFDPSLHTNEENQKCPVSDHKGSADILKQVAGSDTKSFNDSAGTHSKNSNQSQHSLGLEREGEK